MEPSPDPHAPREREVTGNAVSALVGLVATRIEFLGVELRQEALHLQHMLVLGVIAAFCLGSALVMAGILIAAAFWDSHRMLALGAVALLYAIGGAAVLLHLRSSIAKRPLPFDATVREIEADLRALREPSASQEP